MGTGCGVAGSGGMDDSASNEGRPRPRDEVFVAAELQRLTASAKDIERSGNLFYAAAAYRQAEEALDGLAPIDALREHAAELERNPWYRTDAKREREDLTTQSSLESEILRVTGGLREFVGDRSQLQQQASQLIVDLRNRCIREKKEEKKRLLERARRGIFASMIETGEPLIDQRDSQRRRPILSWRWMRGRRFPGRISRLRGAY